MKLSFGYSPCPNDTFIFYALAHQKIDTLGLDVEVILEDVEQLNQWALQGKLAMTKLSYHAFAFVSNEYVLSPYGSALGKGCGPLLIAQTPCSEEEVIQRQVYIPGAYTTAHFLLRYAYPHLRHEAKSILFSEIEQKLLQHKDYLGVIIHENRFTYQSKGLFQIKDLGAYWEQQTGLPIPLGGIAFKRNLPEEVSLKINLLLKNSIEYALANPQETMGYVQNHAQEMDQEVMQKHISLYVNDFTINIGQEGELAVQKMMEYIEKDRGVLVKKPYIYLP